MSEISFDAIPFNFGASVQRISLIYRLPWSKAGTMGIVFQMYADFLMGFNPRSSRNKNCDFNKK